MEIEKTLTVAAPREQVWAMLLDPEVMAGAVPGMKSIDVVSPTEYVAVMHQKISFISAKFKLRTRVVEQRAPEYLRAEGTGEDTAVASSLKQTSEVFLAPTAEGGTELRIKVNVDLVGRLGTFGLGVMKTKADRIWDEFGANLAARLDGGAAPAGAPGPAAGDGADVHAPLPAPSAGTAAAVQPEPAVPPARAAREPLPAPATPLRERRGENWWVRLLGGGKGGAGADIDATDVIRVDVRRGETVLQVQWPGARAAECAAWLRDCLR